MRYDIIKLFLSVSVSATLSVSALAAPAEPLRLKPTSKWISDYQIDGCRLVRQFGEGEEKAIIIMSRFSPGEHFRMTLVGKPFKRQGPDKVKLQFGTSEAEQEMDFLPGTFGQEPSIVMTGSMRMGPLTEDEIAIRKKLKPPMLSAPAPLGAAREKAITYLRIGKPLKKPVILELGAMDKPMAALSTCISDLVKSWGVDPERHKNLSRYAAPTNKPNNWLTSDDYPPKMLDAKQPAIVNYRLLIDEKGAVTGCFIQQTTRPKEFDNAVCKSITKRAKFEPALDEKGTPLLSYYTSTVRFQIYGNGP
jgi:hypothetical protein